MNEPKTLATALATRREARAHLAATEKARVARRDELTVEQQALDNAVQAEAGASLDDAGALAHSRINFEARVRVRQREVAGAEAAHAAARTALADADAAVMRAARAVLASEIHREFDAFAQALETFKRRRERMLAVHLAQPALLTERELQRLAWQPFTADELRLGFPMMPLQVFDPEANWLTSRQRVNAHAEEWQKRLAELEHDAPIESPVQEAARLYREVMA